MYLISTPQSAEATKNRCPDACLSGVRGWLQGDLKVKNLNFCGTLKLGSAALAIGAALLSAPVFAQNESEPEAAVDEDAAKDSDEQIVVTGSRISLPNLTSSVPITSVTGEKLLESGVISIGDKLNQLPALRSTFSQANSTRFLGTDGLNLLDLRGLGTQRTLVLLNGRRHVGSDILANGVSPDTNTFPSDLIERVDVVTGGSSAVYGSDAIAGVVNFILKREFEGLQMRGQAGISDFGDAGSYFASITAGRNFADGRGNIAISLEYAKQEQYFGANRPFIASQDGFITVDRDDVGTPGGSDGVPDTVFFRDIRSATLNNTGLVRFGGNAAVNGGRDVLGGFFNLPFLFATDGTLSPMTGQRVGLASNGAFIGGNGENFRGGDQIQLSPSLDRYSANLIGHFTVSDSFEPFIEAKYARTDSSGIGGSGPAFITGTTLGDAREAPRLNNPFLTAQARGLIIQQLTLQNGVAPAANARFQLRLNMTGLGARKEEFVRETYRGVVGVRGSFNDDWNYEVSANYGEFKEKNRILGNLNTQRFLLAIDAVTDPAQGNKIVCNATINPAAAIDTVGDEAILAADVAACIPINPFGGQFTQEQRNYLLADTIALGKITQFDVNGFVTGDLGAFFEFPGGPVSFAVGGEYRRETNFYTQDPLVSAGYTFYNAIPTFTSPAFEVKEAFGEIRVPLVKDVSLLQELTFTAAGRIADYKRGAGTVYSYNAGIEYSPITDLRLRANFGRAVRAPNLSELFSAPGQNFATVTDPCGERNLALGTANRAANCAADGRPTGYDFVYSQSLEIVSGGNPNLEAEKSDSLTIGGVYQPSFIPGLSLAADYYDIKVKKAIASVGAQTILNQCYDLTTLDNPFCALFERNGSGTGPRGEVPFQVLEASLLQSSINFSGFRVRGIDVELGYRHDFGNLGQYSMRVNYTHTFQNDSFQDPTDPTFITRNLQALGDPVDEFIWSNNLKIGNVNLGYDLRFIGKQLNVAFTSIFPLNGDPAQNLDASETLFFPTVFYHDIKASVDIDKRFNLYAGINNLTNREPPLGATGIGGGSAIFDNRGRFFYLGVKANY
jgi:outer membrane receptor protein involved in Fe transport